MEYDDIIGFSHAEKYCIECGKRESYNILRPLTAPVKCRYCGGRMTDKQTEENLKEFEKDLNKIAKRIDQIASDKDRFTIKLFETLKDSFEDEVNYNGKCVRLMIDNMIKRMR